MSEQVLMERIDTAMEAVKAWPAPAKELMVAYGIGHMMGYERGRAETQADAQDEAETKDNHPA